MYSPIVPIVLFGWIPITIFLFFLTSPQRAVVIAIIGGVMFLPVASYDFPGFPEFDKYTTISIGVFLGGLLSGNFSKYRLKLTCWDIPMIVWCFVVPVITSLSNNLGVYDGISSVLVNFLNWGVFYWTGRRYFTEAHTLRILTWGIVLGGIIYAPLILFEVRMSPQLSNIVYGFFPHSWIAHLRYGGYRPIVFMRSGLMVAFWMSASTLILYWMRRTGEIKSIKNIDGALIVLIMLIASILCKSANGWSYLLLGFVAYSYYRVVGSAKGFRILMIIVVLYMVVRLSGLITIEFVEKMASLFFDDERVASLGWRLLQEDLFGEKAFNRLLFGWGGYGRGWPTDPDTGAQLIQMVDSFWIITLSTYGIIGLISSYLSIGLGPWFVLRMYDHKSKKDKNPYKVDAVVLSIIITFFLIDTLLNAPQSPIYILITGILLNHYITRKDKVRIFSRPNGGLNA